MSDEPCDRSPENDGGGAASVPVPEGLVLVSTPIGNLGDLPPRARDALAAADLILCEDTRRTARLLGASGVRGTLQAFHEHNEDARIEPVLGRLQRGDRVVLVSDAGTPLVSDPGFRLVRAAIAAGLPVSGIPGAHAATLALVLSGLPPLPYLAGGFLPPRPAARRAALTKLRAIERAGLSATLVWYEAPHRLLDTLTDLAELLGPERPAAVARELTKRFEEVRRGSLGALAAHFAAVPARGEITLVVGPPGDKETEPPDIDEQLRTLLETHTVRDAAAIVAGAAGLPRKTVYARALQLSR
ncbi:MAG: 16S rRNA (cytidine(1402)-2'-O)-methyltransferase [Acetobacteraceae bacterium]|nr:16S rRNA (cytidine(1402)-2'-O)-methyltransferase [Acetobacteraceae bacterium]